MYQQAAPVVDRHLLRISYTSLYGWRNRNAIKGNEGETGQEVLACHVIFAYLVRYHPAEIVFSLRWKTGYALL
jgi:hypothetical protein